MWMIEMRVTREYKTRTRLGVPSSITFVPLWYKDTDVIKNGFHPTTCRGRSIKAKQMKFFIDAFWIRERGRSFVTISILSFPNHPNHSLLMTPLTSIYSFIFIVPFFPLLFYGKYFGTSYIHKMKFEESYYVDLFVLIFRREDRFERNYSLILRIHIFLSFSRVLNFHFYFCSSICYRNLLRLDCWAWFREIPSRWRINTRGTRTNTIKGEGGAGTLMYSWAQRSLTETLLNVMLGDRSSNCVRLPPSYHGSIVIWSRY